MNNYKQEYWKIFVFSIVMILAFSGVIMSAIFIIAEGLKKVEIWLAVFVVCGSLTFISVKGIINANKRWKDNTTRKLKEDRTDLITTWHVPAGRWHEFIDEQKAYLEAENRSSLIWAAAVGAIAGAVMGFSVFEVLMASVSVLVGAAGIAIITYLLSGIRDKNIIRKLNSDDGCEIYFSADAIIANDLMVIFNQLGQELIQVSLQDDRTIPVVTFVVQGNTGRTTMQNEYSFPVPDGQLEDARKLVRFYTKFID